MNISEPMTMFTDYLIFSQSLYLFNKLRIQLGDQRNVPQTMWMCALIAIGLASFFGGTYHGLGLMIPENINHFIWKLTTYTIGTVSFLIFYGTMKSSVPKRFHKPLFAISFAQLLFYYYWMFSHDKFMYVIMDYAPSMLMVLVFQVISKFKYNTGSENYFIKGVIISFIGAGVQQNGFDLHTHFNHNDIYHIIQMFGIYMFYKGVPHLKNQS